MPRTAAFFQPNNTGINNPLSDPNFHLQIPEPAMKKYLCLLLAIAGLTFSGCKKIKKALQLDIGFSTKVIDFTLPAVPVSGDLTVDVPVEINLDSVLSANGVSMDKVRKIRLDRIDLDQQNGTSLNNLEAISHIQLAMASDARPEFVTVANLEDNTLPMADPFHLEIPGNPDLDLKPYFHTHQFTYRITAGLRHPTTEEKECTVRTRYIITVGG